MNILLHMKNQIYNQRMFPISKYGAETSVFTKKIMHTMQVHQCTVECGLLNISLKDKKPNRSVRERMKVEDNVKMDLSGSCG